MTADEFARVQRLNELAHALYEFAGVMSSAGAAVTEEMKAIHKESGAEMSSVRVETVKPSR